MGRLSSLGAVILLISGSLWAIPPHLDVAAAKQKLQVANHQAQQAQREYNNHLQAVQEAQNRLRFELQRLDDARRSLAKAKQDLTNLDNAVVRLERKIPELEQTVRNLMNQKAQKESMLGQLKAKLAQLESETNPIKRKIDRVNQEISQIQVQLGPKKSQLQQAASQHQQAKAALQKAKSDVQRLNGVVQNKSAQAKSLRAQIQSTLASKPQLVSQVKSLKGELRQVRQKIQQLGSQIQSTKAQLDAEKAKPEPDKSVVKQLTQKLQGLRQKRQQAMSKKSQLESQVASKESELNGIDSKVASLRSQLKQVNNQLESAKSQLATAKAQVPTLTQKVASLRDKIQSLKAEIGPMENKIARLIQRKNDLMAELGTKEQEIAQLKRQIRDVQNKIASLEQQIRSTKQEKNKAKSRLAQLKAERPSVITRINQAKGDVQHCEQVVAQARRELAHEQRQCDIAKADLDFAQKRAREAKQFYNTVVANYNREKQKVINLANAEGSQDASTDAAFQGSSDGRSAGSSDGVSEGTSEGSKDASNRDYALGYQEGRQSGASDPTVASSYRAGIDLGEALALKKAKAESFPKGYNEALAAVLAGSPSGDALVDLTEEVPQDPGQDGTAINPNGKSVGSVKSPAFPVLQVPSYSVPSAGSPSFGIPSPSKDSYRPPCSNLVLAEFVPLCRSTYQNSYYGNFDSQYASQYRAAYEDGFEDNVKGAYDKALAQSYPASNKSGKEKGAQEQGELDGFAQSLSGFQTAQFNAGKSALVSDMAAGYLVRVKSAELIESNDDGVFTPGEVLQLKLVLDNYGKQATPLNKFRVSIRTTEGMESLTFKTRELPALAGDTRTTILGSVGGTIGKLAPGETIRLTGGIEIATSGGSFKEWKRFDQSVKAHYPIELQEVKLSKTPQVNEKVAATFTFKNLTRNATEEAELALSTSPAMVKVEGDVSLPALDSGETVTVDAEVTPGVWVGGNTPVTFLSKVKNVSGLKETSQPFYKDILINRNGSLNVYRNGKKIPKGTIVVNAGSRAAFDVYFKFHAKSWKQGPFRMKASKVSNPKIKHTSDTTVGVTYGSWSPTSTPFASRVSYNIPRELKGKKEWVMLSLYEGSKVIHAQMIYLDIR